MYESTASTAELEKANLCREIVRNFRDFGSLIAHTNPLYEARDLNGPLGRLHAPKLARLLRQGEYFADGQVDLSAFGGPPGLCASDSVYLGKLLRGSAAPPPRTTIGAVIDYLIECYCGSLATIGSNARTDEERLWILERVQPAAARPLSHADQLSVLRQLVECEEFERFLLTTYPHAKVFCLAGLDALLPGLQALVERACSHGCKHLVMGMTHRGRTATVTHLFNKPVRQTFAEFDAGSRAGDQYFDLEDVRYHLGSQATQTFGGAEIALELVPNPSHLCHVLPVVLGRTRAIQQRSPNHHHHHHRSVTPATNAALSVVVHGDAAFAGQGLIYESLQLADLPGYSVGGTIHVVLDNQIGFTTDPGDARSTPNAADIARAFGALQFTVNADDPASVVHAFRRAFDFRSQFNRDAVITITGYRKYGHNELEDASITDPERSAAIAAKRSVASLYSDQLVADGVVRPDELAKLREDTLASLSREYEARQDVTSPLAWIRSSWQAAVLSPGGGGTAAEQYCTGVPVAELQKLGRRVFCRDPPVTMHPTVDAIYARRRDAIEGKGGVDFAAAEALAFASLLLLDRKSVRLSGQDAERGTFQQRHAVVHCQDAHSAGRRWVPLAAAETPQSRFDVVNSPLSESAVLGFEYGLSAGCADSPLPLPASTAAAASTTAVAAASSSGSTLDECLVVWEAQFGDFLNVAQSIVDSYVVSGEQKWAYQTRMVIVLPHGSDGQGPDHSSARLERLLAASNDDPDAPPGSGLLSATFERQIMKGFDAVDVDGTNCITQDEALRVLHAIVGREPHVYELQGLMREIDTDNSGSISRQEWARFMHNWLSSNPLHTHNCIVAQPTEPAQLFHLIRAQMLRPSPKPLFVAMSKFLLHHRPAVSALADFETGFAPVLVDERAAADDEVPVKVLFLLSGQLYYPLQRHLASAVANYQGPTTTTTSTTTTTTSSSSPPPPAAPGYALVRLEQLSPFPSADLLNMALRRYPEAQLCWVQEEPKNQGAFEYALRRIYSLLAADGDTRRIRFVGRAPNCVAASGSFALHQNEQKQLLDEAAQFLLESRV